MNEPQPAQPSDLRAELVRLTDKLRTSEDEDIRRALSVRISEIESQLKPVEAAKPNLSSKEQADLRTELAKVSAQRYSTEDPELRAQLSARVSEIQSVLGIDVGKLAGGEIAQNAVPTVQPVPAKKKDEKQRVDLAELQAIVAEKSALIRNTENATEIDLPENPEPPTPEQAVAAEKLVQQARVEKMRGNKNETRRLLEEAARVAPGSPSVLELLGDDHAERKQLGKAVAYYRRAAKLDPKNVNVERKLALAALGVSDMSSGPSVSLGGSIDDSAIPMASRNAAMLLSLFLPGLGHIVLGQKTKGWAILAFWCLLLAWTILMGGDVAKLGSMIVGGRSQPNMLVAVPLLLMVITYFVTLADFRGPKETARRPVERPHPPVNLPFE